MATYRDSIYDGYNEAGSDASFRLQYGSGLQSAVEAAVRGGLTAEEVVGLVAIYAVEADYRPRPDSLATVLDVVADYMVDSKEAGVSLPEALGFILSATQDAACRASLSLRFGVGAASH
jgi:hypothetical protein